MHKPRVTLTTTAMIAAATITAAVAFTAIAVGDESDQDQIHGNTEATLADLHAQLARTGHTLDRLEDEREIEVLQRSYGYYVDKSLYDDVTNLFATDGTVEIGGRGVFVGRDRISEYMHWLTPPGPQYNQIFNHTQFQPVLTVSDDGGFAQGRWRALVIGGTGSGLALWGEVTYENEYVKRDGVWQIAQLYAFFNMYTIYDQGWQHSRWPNTQPEADLPPDRPPTAVYDMYPEIHMVPFHYANPVSGIEAGTR